MPAHDKELEKRVDTFLGEFRIMVPALAALLGFQLIAGMQQTYKELSAFHRGVNFAGVLCTAIALGFMLVPTAYHRLAPRLHEDEGFVELAQRSLARGSFFLVLSLTLSLYLQAARSFDTDAVSVAVTVGTLVFLGVAWWLYPRWLARRAAAATGRPGEGRRGFERA